jgi:hypothetical protein
VALAELSVEFMLHQLENEHKEAMSDLIIAQRSKVHNLQFCHVTNLAKEKKKLRMKLISEQLRQNLLYNELLDCRQYTRGVAKLGSVSRSLLSKRLKQLKEWQSKCLKLECVKDDLVDQQRSIVLMEQQLQEYSEIIRNQSNQIDSSTPSTIAKQWVKNKGKKGGHMEWMVQCC